MPLPWFLDEDAQKRKKRQKEKEDRAIKYHAKAGAFDGEVEQASSSMRSWLAEQWEQLPKEEQELVRARRGRRGIRCEVCGNVGFYVEMCPNGCRFEGQTPDSLDLTPPPSPKAGKPGASSATTTNSSAGTGAGERNVGLGVLWGRLGFEGVPLSSLGESVPGKDKTNAGDEQAAPPKHVKRRADLSHMRDDSQDRLTELKISDRGVREYEFYTRAEEGYSRTLPEVTLHQVLRKLMRLLERDLDQNRRNLEAKVDTTLLHPPVLPEAEHFYPPEMSKMKEYTEYFASKAKRAERTDRLAYKFQGNTRPADALDALFRGTGSTSKEANMAATLALYKPDPKAGESAHSKIGWKSNLATNDLLAVADPRAAAKAKEVEDLFRAQGAWTHKQKKDMEQRNDRFEHLVHIIRSELKAEHEREARELTGDSKKVTRQAQMDVFLERLKAVDHLIKVLSLYKLSGPIEDSDLVIFQLRKWQQTLRDRVQAKSRAAGKRQPRRQRGGGTASTARSGTASTAGTWDGGDDEDGAEGDDEGEGGGGGSDGLGLESLDAMAPKTSIKAGAVKSNAMIAKGENPYYEADVYIDKNKRLARKLAKQGNFNPNQPPRYLDSIKSPGGRSPSPSRSRPASPRQQEANAAAAAAADKDGEGSSIASSQEEGDDLASAANDANAAAGLGVFLSAAQGNAAKARKQREEIAANVAQSAADVKELRERDARKAARKAAGWKPKSFVHKYARHQREIDAEEMAAARKTFEEVDFGHHVRQGNRFDLAYLKPALIPVPGAFEGDGKHTLQSYEGEKIVGRARKALVSDLGYTPQRLLPLYVRNTLLEPNGTTPGGDQTQEVMALDRRYSHYVGRPLNRFEPGKELADSKAFLKSSKGFGPNAKELAERLAPIKAERAAKAKAKRIEEMQYHPLNRSLVRVVFGLPIPSVNDVVFQES